MRGRSWTKTQAQQSPQVWLLLPTLCSWSGSEGASNLKWFPCSFSFLTGLTGGPALADSPMKRARAQGQPHLRGYSSEAACPHAASGGPVWNQEPASRGLSPLHPRAQGQSPPAPVWGWARGRGGELREPSWGRRGKGSPAPGTWLSVLGP